MTRFVALLRGVNVGGVSIKMADLAEAFRGLGFTDVKTVLASGNVMFDDEASAAELTPRIQEALRDRFAYDARVHVLESARLREIVDSDPHEEREGWHRYVVFFIDEVPDIALVDSCSAPETETAVIGDGVIYWTVERGRTLDSAFGTLLGDAKYRGNTTNRNLNTLRKLLA